METGGSSEIPTEPKKTKSKTARKPKENPLKQKSPAEFFAENKNIAGFDNPGKSLYTTVRELVENSLDSAESISELPEVEITIEEIGKSKFNSMIGLVDRERIDEELYDDFETAKAREKRLAKEARTQELQAKNAALGKKVKEPQASKGMKGRGEASFYRVTCKDNGRGMPHDDIPNMFGRVLSGTKYGLKQTRGKFGLGAKMALIWSKMSTGLPIEISSSMKGQSYISFCRLDIDIHRNIPHIVGLDIEWRPHPIRSMSNKSATLQLCIDDKCLILQLFYMDEIPESLKSFLADSNFTFVGIEVGDDIAKLKNEYGLDCSRSADIRDLAMQRWPGRFRRPGLKDLAWEVTNLPMKKPKHVSMSNWEARVLSENQIEYACIDAYASYKIGHKLIIEK